MHFQIPESLVELAKKRIEGFPVEGFVRGGGPESPALLLIGEAPGEYEAIEGKPFVGRAGKELDKSLEQIGLSREDVYMTSPVRSRPYKWREKKLPTGEHIQKKYNRPPTKLEILAHAPVLDYEIQQLDPRLIVTLGNVGLQRLLGPSYKVNDWKGQLIHHPVRRLHSLESNEFEWTQESYTIMPTYHPAAVFYNPKIRPELERVWNQIDQYLRNSGD